MAWFERFRGRETWIFKKKACLQYFKLDKKRWFSLVTLLFISFEFKILFFPVKRTRNSFPKKIPFSLIEKRSAGPISTAPTARTKATISSASSTPKLRTEDNSASSSSSRSSQQSNSSPRSNKTGVSVTQRYPTGNNGYV